MNKRPLRLHSRSRTTMMLEGGGSIDYPWWAPTFWHGMGLKVWAGLLVEGQFRISPSRLGTAATISLVSLFNSIGRFIADIVDGQRLKACALPEDPIFIIGHWRSGTTLLHELMMLDPQFCAPSTYQCFTPGHFLWTQGLSRWRVARWLLPSRRPGDNVKVGWDRPQEDEFALMNLGAPSPYRRIAFPHQHKPIPEALDVSKLNRQQQDQWKQAMRDFILRMCIKDKRRLVLKSPTHTARVAVLLELFPKARFIHITRNPYVVFPSTKRIWQSLHKTQSLQAEPTPDLNAYIFNCSQEMQEALDRDRPLLNKNQLHELRYEDLIKDPITTMREAYTKLELGNFTPMKQALEASMPEFQSYKTNRYAITDDLKASIAREWSDFLSRYSYSIEAEDGID